MSLRENLGFETDSCIRIARPLHGLVAAMVAAVPGIHCLRDPTRGGLASTLNEMASNRASACGSAKPPSPSSRKCAAACELLGLDPLYVANEGKLIAIVPATEAERLLPRCETTRLGKDSAIIGEVVRTRTISSKWKPASAATAWSIGWPASSCRGFASPHAHSAPDPWFQQPDSAAVRRAGGGGP